jgi:hypothetical protein
LLFAFERLTEKTFTQYAFYVLFVLAVSSKVNVMSAIGHHGIALANKNPSTERISYGGGTHPNTLMDSRTVAAGMPVRIVYSYWESYNIPRFRNDVAIKTNSFLDKGKINVIQCTQSLLIVSI